MSRTALPKAALLLILGAPLLHAQFRDAWGTGWNNPVSASIGSSLHWKTMMQAPRGRTAPGRASSAQASRTQPSSTPAPSITFAPGAAPIVPRTLAHTLAQDRGHREELDRVFRQFLDLFEKDAAADREPRNLARAAAFFIVASHIAATGRTPAEAHVEALQKNLQANLLENAAFQAKTDRQRQELYETLIIHGYLPLYGVKQGREEKNPDQVARFQTFARQGLKTVLGATPEEMTFTPTGVVFR